MLKRKGFGKSPHGHIYKEYGDLSIALSFRGKQDTLSSLILNYAHPDFIYEKFHIRMRKGFVVTDYRTNKYSLLVHLKNVNSELRKQVKKDIKCLWTEK